MKIFRNKIFFCMVLLACWSTFGFAKMNVGKTQVAVNSNSAKVAAGCPTSTAQIDLAVNNIRARVLVGGDLWWDPVGQTPFYEAPRGSGKTCIYAGALWIGGVDANGQLKVAAQTYRQSGANDFWGGPISKDISGNLDINAAQCNKYDRFWPIERTAVDSFVQFGLDGLSSEAVKSITEWPGNGDVGNGELKSLAPFFDADNDGNYDYQAGDYPYFFFGTEFPKDPVTGTSVCNDYLFGDKSIWWVFNDVGSVKTETNSDPIGLEIRAQAFAFKTNDEINNMTFYKYQIINRSSESLTETYFGVWCDPDLGDASDDYVGCDVGLGLGFVYNGKPSDNVYGANPPAVGIDFFQGPLADPGDGIDNDRDGTLDEIGEEIIMSKFGQFSNVNGSPTGNPDVLDDYYDFLSGRWKDGLGWTYGGDGRGAGPGATSTPCNFLYPGTSDPAFSTNWTMQTGNIQADDMRFLQSAGVFSLAPGAVNYIADGVVFAQATSGGPSASIALMKGGDIKAQKLFNNCFTLKDGPVAPDVSIRELDQEIILSLENVTKTENFRFKDPNIPGVVPSLSGVGQDTLTKDQQSYFFEGYKIYQLLDGTIKANQVTDESKAKLVAQVDLNNDYKVLVNYAKDENFGFYVPTQKTIESNSGITHTFQIRYDLFRQRPLANYRPYYFIVIAYAANNFRTFNPSAVDFTLNTQAEPYLEGSKNVFVYSAIPHKVVTENTGTKLHSAFGDGINIRRIEGAGNGGNVLDLTPETIDEIMNSANNRAVHPVYLAGKAPISVSVYDPLRLKAGGFTLAFAGNTTKDKWYLFTNPTDSITVPTITYRSAISADLASVVALAPASGLNLIKGDFFRISGATGIVSVPSINNFYQVDSIVSDTVYTVLNKVTTAISGVYNASSGKIAKSVTNSIFPIGSNSNQDVLYNPSKISMLVRKDSLEPGPKSTSVGNGFLEATITYSDPSKVWLNSAKDNDVANSPLNWIASGPIGTATPGDLDPDRATNIAASNVAIDPNEDYEKVLDGTWAPYKVTQRQFLASPKLGTSSIEAVSNWKFLASVDVVITSDRNKWTRAVVLETGEDTMPNIGAATKFGKRKQASVDKSGKAYNDGSANVGEASLTDTVGMGWFPGYAINVETGERLNIAFGENSSLVGENSTDMQWNPSTKIGLDANDRVSIGGGHYIYIFNKNGTTANDITIYDNGKRIDSLLSSTSSVAKRNVFKDCIWTSLPVVKAGRSLLETDVKIRLRVKKDLVQFVSSGEPTRYGAPTYEFEISGDLLAQTGVADTAKTALDIIRIVPNPYYAYSSYENTSRDKLQNKIRICNLPSKCTISIYTLNGTLVRQFRRDVSADASDGYQVTSGLDNNLGSTLDWDLKNSAGIKVSSGIYIFHIDAGYLGEKTVKWFGVMRPIDLNSF